MRVALILLCALLGCTNARDGDDAATRASSETLPPVLGIGRVADSALIARLNIDVMPDGTGLPPGSGTAAAGAVAYAAKCAACHGAGGEGVAGVGNRLVQRIPADSFDYALTSRPRAFGSFWPYASTLFDYTRRAMPLDRPGSLTDQEVWDITAFLLERNELIPAGTVLDSATLASIQMPARERFISQEVDVETGVLARPEH